MPVVKALRQHKILLDTHVFLWLVTGNKDLSSTFIKAAERAKESDRLYLSAISVWEIGMLHQRERIDLGMDPLDWMEDAIEESGVQLLPISVPVAIESSRLPGVVHGDPADRLLVATAHEYHTVLSTKDAKLLTYGKNHFISVYNPMKRKRSA